jgi:NitT/TauT family transport system substrate-binding protein
MKKTVKKCMTIVLVLMIIGLTIACGKEEVPSDVRVGSLKGPTSIGLVELMERAENNETENNYSFTMEVAADTLLTMMIQKELDIALVPANVASVLYNKTEGQVVVIDINTLGVLYMLSGDESIEKISDLKGKTIYLTGKGTTPDYVLQYVLEENGLSTEDVTLEYKAEATEVAAHLTMDENAIGLLPQPFATATMVKNDKLKTIFDMNTEWEKVVDDKQSMMVTGVTVVRKEFLEENEGAVKLFLKDQKQSAEYVNSNVENAAALVVKTGIIEKEPIAIKAIPKCNIAYIDGKEMKTALSGYLTVLFNKDAKAVGGSLPEEDFYYLSK